MSKGPKNCKNCPFKSRTVGSRGRLDAPIVIVGEGPGTQEVIKGTPFIGPSGELLSRLLKLHEIPESDCFITNATQCLPPTSKDAQGKPVKDGVLNEAAQACRKRLVKEIEAHPRKVVIAMGSLAAKSLTQKWTQAITRTRGQIVPSPLCPSGILPTLHPAYILRNPSALPQLRSDLAKVTRILSGVGFPNPTVNFKKLETSKEVRNWVLAGLAKAKILGVQPRIVGDIETTGLSLHKDSFRCIGVLFEHDANEKSTEVAIVTGQNSGALVRELFRVAAGRVEWVWHNGKFDTAFLRAHGIPDEDVQVHHDTLLLSYTLDETGGRHSLEQCIVDHLGLPAYKDKLKAHMKATGTDYGTVDAPHLHQYCAEDVTFTALLFRKLHREVMGNNRKPHLQKAYSGLLIPAANTLATIEINGMPIDQEILLRSESELEAKIEPLRAKLTRLAGNQHFNPNSPKQVLAAFRTKRKLKLQSTDEDTLKKHGSDPLAKTLLEYRGLQKMLSTYIRAFKKYGSRVHSSYLIHGTVTGRLSSTSPNMQNIPKEEIVRKHFCTPKGRVFVSFDYSQAELRSLAVLSGDTNLIDIFQSGKDMHAAVAAQVYKDKFTSQLEFLADGITENPVYNKYRRNAKTVNFGIVYGATEFTLMERLGITWDEAHELVVGWFRMFPKAKEFMRECRKAPTTGRPLITVFGRQRRFYVVTSGNRHGQENEAGNFPHQSMCSDFTLDSAIQIEAIRRERGLPGNAQQVNIIHDDNMFECDDDPIEIHKLVHLVRPIMEATPVRHGITLLPFKSDAKQGHTWNRMQKIKGI